MLYLKNLLDTNNLYSGYSQSVVNNLQNDLNHCLPYSYIEFLLHFGERAQFFSGFHFKIDELLEIRKSADLLSIKNKPKLLLKPTDFVFLMNDGYMFFFFNLIEGDNPPIYGFAEGTGLKGFQMICCSLSNFLERMKTKDATLTIPLFKNIGD